MEGYNGTRWLDNESMDKFLQYEARGCSKFSSFSICERSYPANIKRYKSNSYQIDPPLPTPELIRDEFNAYRRTLLQDYLYELIFKEGTTTASSSMGCLEDMPSLMENMECTINCQLQIIESSISALIEEVSHYLF